MSRKISVPDRLYQEAYFLAKERGLDDNAAAWQADLVLEQLSQTPELPKEQNDEAQ